jgi:hypothetical protein
VISGIITTKTQDYRIPLYLGLIMLIAGLASLTSLSPYSGLGKQIGLQIIGGFGLGMILPSIALAAQLGQPDHLHTGALNLVTFFRTFGISLGIAIGATVFQNSFDHEVEKHIAMGDLAGPPKIQASDAEAASILVKDLAVEIAEIYRNIYSDALRNIWITSVTLLGVALVVSLAAQKYTTNGRGLTSKQHFRERRQNSSPRN